MLSLRLSVFSLSWSNDQFFYITVLLLSFMCGSTHYRKFCPVFFSSSLASFEINEMYPKPQSHSIIPTNSVCNNRSKCSPRVFRSISKMNLPLIILCCYLQLASSRTTSTTKREKCPRSLASSWKNFELNWFSRDQVMKS